MFDSERLWQMGVIGIGALSVALAVWLTLSF